MKLHTGMVATLSLAAALACSPAALAHCDTLDGPVVDAARKALDAGNVDLVMVWVQQKDEAEIRAAFDKARNVRRAGGEARELADRYFFENLVRVHRAGEGAPYAGLKPAGTIEPPVASADKAIATGRLQDLDTLIARRMQSGLHRHFEQVMAKKDYAPDDVEAGRAFSSAYVEFVHYAERLYSAAETMSPDRVEAPAAAHAH